MNKKLTDEEIYKILINTKANFICTVSHYGVPYLCDLLLLSLVNYNEEIYRCYLSCDLFRGKFVSKYIKEFIPPKGKSYNKIWWNFDNVSPYAKRYRLSVEVREKYLDNLISIYAERVRNRKILKKHPFLGCIGFSNLKRITRLVKSLCVLFQKLNFTK